MTVATPQANILLVDDEPANLLALEAVLHDLAENIVPARSGEEALRFLAEMDFAVVLLDVQMPGMDGFDTAATIRNGERSRHTPIIFLTAYDVDPALIERAYLLGAVDILVKPLVPIILRAKVAGFVELFMKTEEVRLQAEPLWELERQRAERALRESEERFRASFDQAAFGLGLVGLDHRTLWANPGLCARLGYSEAEMRERTFADLTHPDDLEADLAQGRRLLAGEILSYRIEKRYLHEGGSIVWGDLSVSLVRDAEGRPKYVVGVVVDITERKQVEEALKEADRRKDQFLFMLAHELRNPLAPIQNALHVLQQLGAPDPTVQQYQEMIERQVKHLTRLVNDLLEVNRAIRGRIELRRERLDLARLVRTAAADHRNAFDRAGLALDVAVPELPVWIMGDPTRLTQVLDNLLQNGLKFTERGGRVRVGLAVRCGEVEVVTRDTGVGIEPDVLPHIFEAFTQADRSLDRSRGGLGLGLSLVKRLVDLHGGEVRASSAGPGRGAEFLIRLPVEPEPAALSEMPTAPRPAGKRLRILVVEDSRDAADSLKMLLELYGYEVVVAYSRPDGVERTEAWRPNVVLCDIGLPGLDGYGVASELRRKSFTAKARLIAVTGYGSEEDRRRSQEPGFHAHLTKPVDPAILEMLLADVGHGSDAGPVLAAP
jgi:PAS domain S-box-containing protein